MSRGDGGCGSGGVPDNPDARRAMANLAATIEARRTDRSVRWRELADNNPRTGPYWREWHCKPPSARALWRAIRQEWDPPGDDGLPVRKIYEIELAGG